MKIAINRRIETGPWGGANQFLKALVENLTFMGDDVVFDLSDPDIDIIFFLVPRRRGSRATFGARDAIFYLWRNPKSKARIVHRINDCDERKGTKGVNSRLRRLNSIADHTVFVGSWMKDLSVWTPTRQKSFSTILNGADSRVFYPSEVGWKRDRPLKLVTHHWSGNWKKGFDSYLLVDRLLDDGTWRKRLAFTIVGRVPKNAVFRNTRLVPPLEGVELGAELRRHDAYITGSLNEPGSMHQVEGMMSGLPVVYRLSGGLPESCEGFGEAFLEADDLILALERLFVNFEDWRHRVLTAPYLASNMVERYRQDFEAILTVKVSTSTRWRALTKLMRRLLVF